MVKNWNYLQKINIVKKASTALCFRSYVYKTEYTIGVVIGCYGNCCHPGGIHSDPFTDDLQFKGEGLLRLWVIIIIDSKGQGDQIRTPGVKWAHATCAHKIVVSVWGAFNLL